MTLVILLGWLWLLVVCLYLLYKAFGLGVLAYYMIGPFDKKLAIGVGIVASIVFALASWGLYGAIINLPFTITVTP